MPDEKTGKNQGRNTLSRFEKLKREFSLNDPRLEMPKIDFGFEHLTAYMDEIGYAHSGVAGPVAVSFVELEAWQRTTGLTLEAWEILALSRMSSQYVMQYNSSSDPKAQAPFTPKEINRDKVSDNISSFFKAKMKQQEKAKSKRG